MTVMRMTAKSNTKARDGAYASSESLRILRFAGQVVQAHKAIMIPGNICRERHVTADATAIVAVPRLHFVLEG